MKGAANQRINEQGLLVPRCRYEIVKAEMTEMAEMAEMAAITHTHTHIPFVYRVRHGGQDGQGGRASELMFQHVYDFIMNMTL